MGIIRGILEDEHERLQNLSVFYKKKISEYPQGVISIKERGGQKYIYLAYRKDKKVVFDYIGKDVPEERKALCAKLKQRKEYQAKLQQVKENLREIERSLRGKRK